MSRKTYSFGPVLPPPPKFSRANYEAQCAGLPRRVVDVFGEESLSEAELPRLVAPTPELPAGVDLLARWRKEGAR